MKIQKVLSLLSIILFLQSCEDNTECCPMPVPESEFESGIIVLNEGNYGSANATISFIDYDTDENQSQVFKNTNRFELGDTAQSIALVGDLALIVVNVSNKVEIVDRNTFKTLATLNTNLQNPRYAEIIGDLIYVSNWGDGFNSGDDFIAVYNLMDYSYVQSIPVAEGPEKMIENEGSLYVAHLGGYAFNNLISVINASSNTVIKEIEVGDLPNSMAVSGNDLWILSAGKPPYADMETAGSISRIDLSSNILLEKLEFTDESFHPENLNVIDGMAYYTANKSLYKYNIGNSFPVAPAFNFEEVAVLYGFEIENGLIYIASPRADFTGNGNLFIYDLDNGELMNNYKVGVNPNGVYFN